MRASTPLQVINEVWRSMAKEWLWVYRGAPLLTDQWSPSILVPPGVFFVERGLVLIEADGKEIQVPAGSAFLTAPGLRRQRLAEGTILLSAGFRCTWPDGTPLFRSGLNIAMSSQQMQKLHRATDALFKAVHGKRKHVTYHDAVQPQARKTQDWCRHDAAYLTWFCEFAETMKSLGIACETPHSSNERLLAKVLACLNESPLDQANPSLLKTTTIGIGARRVEQLLQERYGLTTRAWHERRRLDAARQRLQQETTPLKEIGFQLGFRHASHFTAWFKRCNGVSPSAFRQSSGHAAV